MRASSSVSPEPEDLRSRLLTLLPGAAQGATVVLLGHPIDTVKTRVQSSTMDSVTGASVKMKSVAMNMWRSEGPSAFYRGVSPPLVLTATKRSLQFALWEHLRVSSKFGEGMSSGAIAGFCGTLIGCPMHVVKIQTQNSQKSHMRNAASCAADIWRKEGLRGFYRGMYAQVIKDTAFASVYLSLYGKGRKWITEHPDKSDNLLTLPWERRKMKYQQQDRSSSSNPAQQQKPMGACHMDNSKMPIPATCAPPASTGGSGAIFLCGCFASMATWIVLHPLDTFKTYVQSRHSPREFFFALRSLGRSADGSGSVMAFFKVLWRGLPASLFRAGPVAGAAMVSYEFARSLVGVRIKRQKQVNAITEVPSPPAV